MLQNLTIQPRSWIPWKIKINCNGLHKLNVLASPGHDLVNFNKKYQLPPFLVIQGFKTTDICNKFWILEPQNQSAIHKVHNKQSIIVFLFFEVYNVNYKGELTSLYVGFSKKSNSHLSVFLSSSENCQFKLMVLVCREGKFKSSAAEYILNLITQ